MFSSTIYLHHPDSSPRPSIRVGDTYILFFITGNPGLIEYYRTFLSHLYALLSSTGSDQASAGADQFQVFGRDLLGFQVEHADPANGASPPYGLEAQIEATEKALDTLVSDGTTNVQGNRPKVILIGHSVGAYILLEVLRQHREKLREEAPQKAMTIIGGVCLFPTVTHIMQSRSGKSAGVCKTPYLSYLSVFGRVARHAELSICWHCDLEPKSYHCVQFLLCRPYFARAAGLIAQLLLVFVPSVLLRLLIHMVTGFPADAVATTAAFVRSKWGVRQALHMARDEMLSITTDAWDEEVWGAAHPSPTSHPRAQLRFLFGKGDHWVAEETRDDLIRTRASKEDTELEEAWKPKMEVTEEGWPHAFCIRHSVPVAEKVAVYVRDIIRGDKQDVDLHK